MTEARPLGDPVGDWTPPPAPPREPIEGRWTRLVPFDPARHAAEIHAANDGSVSMWDYMPNGPFADYDSYIAWAEEAAKSSDPLFFAVIDKTDGKAKGVVSYLRITPVMGVIEVGNIAFSPPLQRTREGTEAMYLMMRRAFELGYRRYEWKCNHFNSPSRRLAQRLGLSFEGVFRRHMVVKGRNRDTAWYAAIDAEWPQLRAAFETWLAPDNFDGNGRQRQSLTPLTRPILVATG
ncbi:MAG: GNAT family N-acetyltransferase [Pikeienuella sp.]